MITTVGRELVKNELPDKYKKYAEETIDKKRASILLTELAKDDPDAYIDILDRLSKIGEDIVSTHGREAALSYKDVKLTAPIKELNNKLKLVIKNVLNDKNLTEAQKEAKIIELGYKYSQKVQDAVYEDHNKRKTSLASQINSGSRGNKVQLMQLGFGNMLMKDALNRDIPYLMLDPYIKGVSPMSYWVSASSGRKGFYDVQAATGQAGYLGKQVSAATHRTTIETDDCGTTDTGVPYPANSDKNIGAVLLRPFHKYPAGSIVTEEMVAEAEDGEEMILRSPTTCKCRTGICAKCSGLNENGKFPAIGDYVPLNAARTFVEPLTQSGISCLHPDTLVTLKSGEAKKIKDLRVDDTVYGSDLEGNIRSTRVSKVFNHGIMPMYKYIFNISGKSDVELIATEEHKVVNYNTKSLVTLRSLSIGDAVLCVNDEPVKGVLVDRTPFGACVAFDIEVEHKNHLFLLDNCLIVSNSKHTGGVGGKKVIDPEGEDQPTGFRKLERLFMVPKSFPGGAVLSPVDGTISNITKAPQGGTYITVGSETVYALPARTIKVSVGDKVTAGDVLTNGVPNPEEITKYKGLGLGRKYFTDKLDETLQQMGIASDRRNLEAFSRSLVSKVIIDDANGFKSYLPGEIADYNEITADYTPDEDSVEYTTADKAINKYLEKPVLYYTIGTKITPSVAAELKKYNFNDVVVSSKTPKFSAKFLRPAVVIQHDSNWIPRLAGERLQTALFDATRKGITDSYDSTSYVNKIVSSPYK